MKQGNTLVNFVMIALAVALALYMGIYVYRGFSDPFTTTYAYEYVSNDAVEAEGILVRQERVFQEQVGIVDVTRGEGEKVGKGQTVALVHKDSKAVETQAELDQLELEISLLDFALGQGDTSISTAHLDESILQSMVELRATAAVSDYSDLEDQVRALKSQVLKREYTYDENLDIGQLQQQRSELVNQYKDLKSQISGATSRITASEPGTFSALVDGYEELLTPETIRTITPSRLEELRKRKMDASAAPGKLVTSEKWYFTATLSSENAQRLSVGKTVLVGFSGDFSQDVSMLVELVSEPEDGRCVVVLSSDSYLRETLLLRQQSVEIIYKRSTGLRVPKTCLRMITKTTTDKETGETVEEEILGLYALVGGQAEFKKVEIQGEGSDYYVVTPATEGSRALRAGDEIIVRATDLYDGKLLTY